MSSDHGNSSQPPESGLSPRAIAAIVAGILALIFIIENSHKTKIRFIIPQVNAPLWLALLITALLGGIAGALLQRRRK
jgi:uncharacterized integral membrane protein